MALFDPQPLHPALWLASQLTKGATSCVDTGIPVFSHQLPGGGWPTGVLTELLLQQPGIGELRLLQAALASQKLPVALLQPPYAPQTLGLDLPSQQLLWLRNTGKAADS